jgi:NAD(P)H-quinone oxidoreductase subunit 5
MPVDIIPFIAPVILLLAALAAFLRPGRRPPLIPKLTEGAALVALAVAAGSAVLLVAYGPHTGEIMGFGKIGLSTRIDVVSVTMLVLVAFVGWIVLRYSASYLDGEARHGAFLGWMAATLASVLLLVQAGNLVLFVAAWIASSLYLRRLLLFYGDRIQAVRAARKQLI